MSEPFDFDTTDRIERELASELPWSGADSPPTLNGARGRPKCRRHEWEQTGAGLPWPARCLLCTLVTEDPDAYFFPQDTDPEMIPEYARCLAGAGWLHLIDDNIRCSRCGAVRDPAASRRGRTNRSRGNRAELSVARLYGGEKTGPLGGPEDIRGAEFRSQVKTHQRLPPAEWAKAFAGMATQHDGRTPRLILRYLPGQGIAADDYIVLRGRDWLERFGRDE